MGNFSLKIEDFQSIGNAELEFTPGINLIVGQSNSGKTAILRAIDSVLTNPTYAKSFIKHHTNETSVTFQYNDNTISWKKSGKGGTTYNVNNEEYSKMGTSDLFDILPNNGFVKSDNGEVMNIEGEWDLPFPFDRTPSELFRLFENVFCVSDSATILKSFKEEESDLIRQMSDSKDKIGKSTNKLAALEELEKEADLPKLKRNLREFEAKAENYFKMNNDYETVKKSEVLDGFVLDEKVPPETNSLADLLEAEKDVEFVSDVAKKIKFYKTLPEIMEVPDSLPKYTAMFEDLIIVENACLADNFMVDKKIEIKEGTLPSYCNLLEDLKDIEKGALADKFSIDKSCSEDSSLSLADYTAMAEDLVDITECFRRCKVLTANGKELVEKIAHLEAQLKEYKVCPLCGHELNGEHEEC